MRLKLEYFIGTLSFIIGFLNFWATLNNNSLYGKVSFFIGVICCFFSALLFFSSYRSSHPSKNHLYHTMQVYQPPQDQKHTEETSENSAESKMNEIPNSFVSTQSQQPQVHQTKAEAKEEKADWMRKNPTPAERKMHKILTNLVQPLFPEHPFESQVVKAGYILDFYAPSLDLAIEVDGSSHDGKIGYDWERDSHLGKLGIQVFRATNLDVFNYQEDLANALSNIIREKNGQTRVNYEYQKKPFREKKYRRSYPPRRY
jgi:very-short-patch-repair endonuclease